MIIKLSNGTEIVLEDVVKDPKATSLQWLREYKARKEKARDGPGLTDNPPLTTTAERSL